MAALAETGYQIVVQHEASRCARSRRRSPRGKRTYKAASSAWLDAGPDRHDYLPLLRSETGCPKTTTRCEFTVRFTRGMLSPKGRTAEKKDTPSGGASDRSTGESRPGTPKSKAMANLAWRTARALSERHGVEACRVAPLITRWLTIGCDRMRIERRFAECVAAARRFDQARKRAGKAPIQNVIGYAVTLWALTPCAELQAVEVRQATDQIAAARRWYAAIQAERERAAAEALAEATAAASRPAPPPRARTSGPLVIPADVAAAGLARARAQLAALGFSIQTP